MDFQTITENDLPLIRSINGNPRMMAYLGGAQTQEQIRRAHASILLAVEEGGWCFKVLPEPDGPVAGTVLIWKSTWNDEAINEIGWMILPAFQGRGIASLAVASMLRRARTQRAFDAIDAFPSILNAASNRICEKNGFTKLEPCRFTYAGNAQQCNHWRIEL